MFYRSYFINISPIKEITQLVVTKHQNFKEAITEMYPRIPWELVAGLLGSAEHTLVTTTLYYIVAAFVCIYKHLVLHSIHCGSRAANISNL
jgi:hypothetical protein